LLDSLLQEKMALNTAHANGGVLIHAGESILLFCDNVTMEFAGQDGPEFKGSKQGRLYLTTHRMIFNNKKTDDKMVSFSFPFVALKDVELEQPVFGANYIKGKVRAQPGGNFTGEAKFKLHFKSGGAIDFGQAMLKAAQMAGRHTVSDAPPPYQPPSSDWYAAPPPAYSANPAGYGGWVPPTHAFPDMPPANSVYMTDAPPPYPGINGTNGYSNGAGGGGGGAGGWTAPHVNGSTQMTSAERKAAEASAPPVQTGYFDPNNPGQAYVPPPDYYNDPPPGYADTRDKKK
jgi:hypothetical protein